MPPDIREGGGDDERDLLATMCLARAFEEKVSELSGRKEIGGLLHLGIGQEAVAVGVCSQLRRDDYVVCGHRAHVHAIAKGADPARLLAELAGRETGYCGGRGGSMHIAAVEVGFVTATGVVAGNLPLALGAALSCRSRGRGQVAVAFFGDGAGQAGAFHESLNLASLWGLPVLLVCENNGYAEFTPLAAHTRVARLADHAATYGIPRSTIDGNDLRAVREAAAEALSRARAGEGPTFIEALTYRLRGHYEGDAARYRELSELEEWRAKDPILRWARTCGLEGRLDRIRREAGERVATAARAALAAPPAEAG
jgi:TPP-dependent pyruvate/acetoin dehydrogenase alpha subunit